MEIRVDGNRSSAENWMRAQNASIRELPILSPEQKTVANKLGLCDEDYARSAFAGDLERENLKKKAQQAARLIGQLASRKVPGIRVESVWLKTFDRKFRFDLEFNGSDALIFVSEDLIDELFESGSRLAEEQLLRIVDLGLPSAWTAMAS